MSDTFPRGFLTNPRVKAYLAAMSPDEPFAEEMEALAIRERNEETYLRGVRRWFEQTDEVSR
jgi:hypothetical protein